MTTDHLLSLINSEIASFLSNREYYIRKKGEIAFEKKMHSTFIASITKHLDLYFERAPKLFHTSQKLTKKLRNETNLSGHSKNLNRIIGQLKLDFGNPVLVTERFEKGTLSEKIRESICVSLGFFIKELGGSVNRDLVYLKQDFRCGS